MPTRSILALIVALGGSVLPATAGAWTIQGAARVVDGDTLEVAGTRVRLHGIDAPETAQTCRRRDGEAWQCGRAASAHLTRIIGRRLVTCDGSERDAYGRLIAVCRVAETGPSLNERMVTDGMAWAFVRYSHDYGPAERGAREDLRGIFDGENQPAWQFRAQRWQTDANAAPGGCPIKGNINRRGERIYHLPWDRFYATTRIDVHRGERWFCDEAEAVRNGWRRARG